MLSLYFFYKSRILFRGNTRILLENKQQLHFVPSCFVLWGRGLSLRAKFRNPYSNDVVQKLQCAQRQVVFMLLPKTTLFSNLKLEFALSLVVLNHAKETRKKSETICCLEQIMTNLPVCWGKFHSGKGI